MQCCGVHKTIEMTKLESKPSDCTVDSNALSTVVYTLNSTRRSSKSFTRIATMKAITMWRLAEMAIVLSSSRR